MRSFEEDITRRLMALETRLSQVLSAEVPVYETGTFVPTLVGSGTAGTFTYTNTLVEYTRIGNRLFYNGRMGITAVAVAPIGNLTINGWPYIGVSDPTSGVAGVGAMEWIRVVLPAGFTVINLQFVNNATPGLVRSGQNVNLVAVQGGELGVVPYDFRFGGNYKVA